MNQKIHNQVVGMRISKLRIKQKLNHEKLGKVVGLSKIEILRVEKGLFNPGNEKLCLLADVLGVTISELMRID